MVKLITVATHYEGYLKWLEASCKRYNVNLIKLGWGEKWKDFAWRFDLVLNYLEIIIKQDPYELIIFIDGYDVLLLKSLDDIEQVFNQITKYTNKKIIISKDRHYYYHKLIFAYWKFDICKGLLLNAGTYMGRVIDVFNMLKQIKQNNSNNIRDDQILLTQFCNSHQDSIYIDNDSNLFLVYMNPLKSILLNKNIIINQNNKVLYFNTKPYFIHGNGNTILYDLLIKLGYNLDQNEITTLYYWSLKNRIIKIIKSSKILLIIEIYCFVIFYCLKNIYLYSKR